MLFGFGGQQSGLILRYHYGLICFALFRWDPLFVHRLQEIKKGRKDRGGCSSGFVVRISLHRAALIPVSVSPSFWLRI